MEFLGQVAEWFADPAHWSGPAGVPSRLLEHVWLSVLSVALASLIALPLGLYIGHTRRLEFLIVSMANFWRAVPSLAILGGAFILYLRVGLAFTVWPTVTALVVLAIPPILTNTYVGVQGVEPDTVEAATGQGMSGRQLLRQVEVPLAAPLILAGLRTAAVQVVATATLAAIVAGGGLGRFIVDGFALGVRGRPQIFAGAVLVALLAIATELGMGLLERRASPQTAARDLAILRSPGQLPGPSDVGSI